MKNSKVEGDERSETMQRWVPSMERSPGHPFAGYLVFLSLAMLMTWLESYDAFTLELPYYYEHFVLGYASLLGAAYLGFTRPTTNRAAAAVNGGMKFGIETPSGAGWILLDCLLNALYLALLTFPFLAAVRILTMLRFSQIVLILLLIAVCFTTYRLIALQLERVLEGHDIVRSLVLGFLFMFLLFATLGLYPPLSPFFALHRISSLSALRIDGLSFYHPLGTYITTVLLHGLIICAIVSADLLLGMRRSVGHAS